MKTFSFFVEPSQYTIDTIESIHKKLDIDFIFFNEMPLMSKAASENRFATLSNLKGWDRIRTLYTIWKNHDFFIFNGYDRWEFLLFFLAATFANGRKYLAIESDTQYRPVGGLKGALKRLYLRSVFSRPFVLGFAGGTGSHKDLFRRYGMGEDRIFLMPMMVNNERFQREEPRPAGPFTFLYVGRLIPHKNVAFALEAFVEAFKGHEDVLFRIVGDGESLDALKKNFSHYANVHFEGAKYGKELVHAYHTSHVLVIPSLYEPWGLVVNEAMAAGLPVLASDRVGAVGDLVKEGETGFVFDPLNKRQLSALMRTIHGDETSYERLARNAQALMKNHWNYELYRTNLVDAIDYVCRHLPKVSR